MRYLLLFFFGLATGAIGYHLYRESNPPERPIAEAKEEAREAARETRDAIGEKLEEWNLTPDDIRRDLSRGGEIVRSKAARAGSEFTDARILTVIKSKYVVERDLSARDIQVTVDKRHVVLSGQVPTPAHVGRAIAIALDTDGVDSVSSRLTVGSR